MFNYLYYKLYQASLKSSLRDVPQVLAPIFFGGLISANVLVVSGFLAKIDALPFLFSKNTQGGGFALILIFLAMLYFKKPRVARILEKYSRETEKERITGNIIVSVYVGLSFLLIFAVAFFRPGKL